MSRVLRRYIREFILKEYGQATGASGTDPTNPEGFYPYELERGVDIQGFWYKSPGREMGSEGDPYRPADAAEYLGMKSTLAEPATEEGGTTKETGSESTVTGL